MCDQGYIVIDGLEESRYIKFRVIKNSKTKIDVFLYYQGLRINTKWVVPSEIIKEVLFKLDDQGVINLILVKKEDKQENACLRKKKPVLFWLGLIELQLETEVNLGSFQSNDDKKMIQKFLNYFNIPFREVGCS